MTVFTTIEEKIERLQELQQEVRDHDLRYDKGQPIISDSQYDALYEELTSLEKELPSLDHSNSPTHKIVHVSVESLKKVDHVEPMLSQEKITTEEGIQKFVSKQARGLLLVQQKLDGLTIVLTYENGKLLQAVTRGDGFTGEDVTHTVSTIRNVPKEIDFANRLVVRMEAVLPFAEFERINTDGRYSNPRNLVSGTVRQLDPSVAASRKLEGIVFDTIFIEGEVFESDLEQLDLLDHLGFTTVETKVFEIGEDVAKEISAYVVDYGENVRPKLLHMIDGKILKFDDLSIRAALGSGSKNPRWACAYKFPSLDAVTTLTDVVFQVGKSGQITPVAEFETVEIDAVNISRATLHNFRNIGDKDIRVGDQIVVERANDVIPRVVQSLHEERKGYEVAVRVPVDCPSCGAHTNLVGENLFCMGASCTPQLEGKLVHFTKRDAMNVDGLGEKTVIQLYSEGLIQSVADIYNLTEKKEAILELPRFGVKKYQKMIAGIEASKDRPFAFALYGLSIPLIGRTASRELSKHFDSVYAMVDEFEQDPVIFEAKIINIPDFGETMTKNLVEFLATDANRELIEELKALGVKMESEVVEEPSEESTILGKRFVITGTLSKGRGEFKSEIELLGGKVTGSVTKSTDYLLIGDGAGGTSKHKKALELGVTILNEQGYIQLLGK